MCPGRRVAPASAPAPHPPSMLGPDAEAAHPDARPDAHPDAHPEAHPDPDAHPEAHPDAHPDPEEAALALAQLNHAHNLQQPLLRLPREIILQILALVALESGRDFRRATRAASVFTISPRDSLFWRTLCQSQYEDTEDQARRYGSYHALFCKRPQPRFGGVYICTSHYYRHAEQQGGSWYQQLILVTYYRYIRLYPDGRCQSLLTVREPESVLPFDQSYAKDRVNHGEWRIDRDRNVLALHVDMDKYMGHLSFKIQSEGGRLHNKLRWRSLRVRNHGEWDDVSTAREGNFYFKRLAAPPPTAPPPTAPS